MLKKDTVDSVVSDLVNAVDRLRNLHDRLAVKIGKANEAISKLEGKKSKFAEEQKKAEKVINRLSYILGDE